MLEEDPDQARRNHADDKEAGVAQRIRLAPEDADRELPETAAIHDENRSECRDVEGNFHKHAGRVHAGDVSDDGEVSVARDRKKLGKSLHQPEQNALPERHATFPATSAINPTTMAPLSRMLTRFTFPSSNQVAARSTVIWASNAIKKYARPYPALHGNSRLAGTNSSAAPAEMTSAGPCPTAIGRVRRPMTRSPTSSSTSFTISRTKCSHAARTHGT